MKFIVSHDVIVRLEAVVDAESEEAALEKGKSGEIDEWDSVGDYIPFNHPVWNVEPYVEEESA